MAATFYDRLTALDASFLDIEDVNSHMHVAAVMLFDGAPVDSERVRTYLASRLHLIPRYRQRLAWVPFEQHPVWIDDPSFNVFYHVRHTALPQPGSERQLKRLCGRILSQQLDRTKPLWEVWLVEGLANDQFAVIVKAHHCMVDGISGMDLLAALLSPTPVTDFDPGPEWKPRPAPSGLDLVLGEAWRRATLPLALLRGNPADNVRRATDMVSRGARGVIETLYGTATPASLTPFNPLQIGPHRRFDWLRTTLGELSTVKKRFGGTVNDVILAAVAGGTRRFLDQRGWNTDVLDFRALVPVSIRHASERGQLGNRVAQMLTPLPISEPDPRRRIASIIRTTTRLKQSNQASGGELLEEVGNWTAKTVLSQVLRLSTQRRMFNLVVTNVPGPQDKLYLLGAPMRAVVPMVPLFANQAAGIALFSYAGDIYWGLSGDWDSLPDLHDFALNLGAELRELQHLTSNASAA